MGVFKMKNLREKAVLVNLKIRSWSGRKFDKKVTAEVNEKHGATNDAGRYNKLVLAKDALKEIKKIENKIRTFHYENTSPWGDDGARILKISRHQEYTSEINKMKMDLETELEKFISLYPEYIEQARLRLNRMFNAEDYPSADILREKFEIKVSFLPLPNLEDFRVTLGNDQVKEICENVEAQIKDANTEIAKDLYSRLFDTVNHMVERLSGENTFRNSLVGNIIKVVNLIPKLNINDDPKIEELKKNVEEKLTALSADEIRSNGAVKERVLNDAKDCLKDITNAMADIF